MWDWEAIKNWNSFAPWLSGIGSLSAVIVTLWLVRREKYVRLAVETGYATSSMGQSAIMARVTNVGVRKANIKEIYIKAGLFRSSIDVPLPIQLRVSPILPTTLEDGDFIEIDLPMEAIAIQLKQRFRDAAWWNGGVSATLFLRTVKIGVSTSTGKIFEGRMNTEGKENFLRFFRLADQPLE